MATQAERQRRREWQERRVFLAAAKFDVFTIRDVQEAAPGMMYFPVARMLLGWWRDQGLTERWDDYEGWRTGYPWSKVSPGGKAIYRWVGEEVGLIPDRVKQALVEEALKAQNENRYGIFTNPYILGLLSAINLIGRMDQ